MLSHWIILVGSKLVETILRDKIFLGKLLLKYSFCSQTRFPASFIFWTFQIKVQPHLKPWRPWKLNTPSDKSKLRVYLSPTQINCNKNYILSKIFSFSWIFPVVFPAQNLLRNATAGKHATCYIITHWISPKYLHTYLEIFNLKKSPMLTSCMFKNIWR